MGLAISTIGRPTLSRLLDSLTGSAQRPSAVGIADQSPEGLQLVPGSWPFPVRVVRSSGGLSTGRNAAVELLGADADVVGFPNDDTVYPPETLARVGAAFAADAGAAVACSLVEEGRPRFELPRGGGLDRRSVWRAIEPATFVRVPVFRALQGFRQDLGTGCATPWQSGEGTELLLRILASGQVVSSRPDIAVTGFGERRTLSDAELVSKHRRYARGTGYVYRLHHYPLSARCRIVVAPWVKITQHADTPALGLRLAYARSLGRIEGLLARTS